MLECSELTLEQLDFSELDSLAFYGGGLTLFFQSCIFMRILVPSLNSCVLIPEFNRWLIFISLTLS